MSPLKKYRRQVEGRAFNMPIRPDITTEVCIWACKRLARLHQMNFLRRWWHRKEIQELEAFFKIA